MFVVVLRYFSRIRYIKEGKKESVKIVQSLVSLPNLLKFIHNLRTILSCLPFFFLIKM